MKKLAYRKYFGDAYEEATAVLTKIAELNRRVLVEMPVGYLPDSHRVEPELEAEYWKRRAKEFRDKHGDRPSTSFKPSQSISSGSGKVRQIGLYYHDPYLTVNKLPKDSPLRAHFK